MQFLLITGWPWAKVLITSTTKNKQTNSRNLFTTLDIWEAEGKYTSLTLANLEQILRQTIGQNKKNLNYLTLTRSNASWVRNNDIDDIGDHR